jgi:hypothetical protein
MITGPTGVACRQQLLMGDPAVRPAIVRYVTSSRQVLRGRRLRVAHGDVPGADIGPYRAQNRVGQSAEKGATAAFGEEPGIHGVADAARSVRLACKSWHVFKNS